MYKAASIDGKSSAAMKLAKTSCLTSSHVPCDYVGLSLSDVAYEGLAPQTADITFSGSGAKGKKPVCLEGRREILFKGIRQQTHLLESRAWKTGGPLALLSSGSSSQQGDET